MRHPIKRSPAIVVAAAAALACGGEAGPPSGASDAPGPPAPRLEGVRGPALPLADPGTVGMSGEALDRIAPAMRAMVDDGQLPGVMTLVARDGRIVHWEAVGMRDVAAGDPLEPDDIFRIYSMTKPVTSVAIMMLEESGDLALDDPVSKFIPAFGEVAVYREDGEPRPPADPVTIRHLLTHTGGLTYGIFGDTPVDRMYAEAGLFQAESLEEFVDILAGLPLLADPGDRWNYSVSTDVLGRVVEVASGEPFATFLEERIFEPLGMDDSGFQVSPGALPRFAWHYAAGEDGLRVVDGEDGRYSRPPPFASGGGGLVSSASDYVRFAQMLLQEGEVDGVRLLEPETVRAMRTNALPDALMPLRVPNWFSAGYGFGLGFATLVDEAATPEDDRAGTFRWGGLANTFFWIDPQTDLIGMVWTQMDPFLAHGLERRFQEMVYDALEPVP